MPPHLQLTLLNVPPALDAQAVLPRPQHVILNHVYCQRGQVRSGWAEGVYVHVLACISMRAWGCTALWFD